LLGAALGYGLGRAICKEGDTGCLTSAATFGGAIGAVGGVMVQKYGFMANSREDEMEADRIGFRLAVNAGYDKNQVGRFYERLLEMEKKRGKEGGAILKSLSDALSTHPPSEERVKQMKDLARESPAARNVLVDTAEFKRVRGVAASWSRK
jgi:predicted Zn-dependent protease